MSTEAKKRCKEELVLKICSKKQKSFQKLQRKQKEVEKTKIQYREMRTKIERADNVLKMQMKQGEYQASTKKIDTKRESLRLRERVYGGTRRETMNSASLS